MRMFMLCSLVALGLAQAPARAQDIGIVAAMQIAEDKAGGGQVVVGRSEFKGGNHLYGFYFLINGRILEVEVRAPRGDVEKVKEANDPAITQAVMDALKARKGSKIPLFRLVEIAMQKNANAKVARFELTTEEGKLLVLVDVVTPEKTLQLTIDPEFSKVIRTVEVKSKS